MSPASLYSIIALLTIVIVALLLRPGRDASPAGRARDTISAEGLWDSAGLSLAERILDPADYYWLRDELGFPTLAESLREHRKRLALDWLKAVRRSFVEMVRTPESLAPGSPEAGKQESWELLRITLRFHFFLIYALLVVRFFGPYHRLIPSLGWAERPWSALLHSQPFGASPSRRSY
jgi:hypothetical protein